MDSKLKNRIYYWIIGFLFVFGVILRTVVLGLNTEFEDDECRLLLGMMNRSYLELFAPLGYSQSAPPIFLMILKFFGDISNQSEFVMKLVPYVFSIGSLFAFFKLSKKFFRHRYSIITANALFCLINKTILFSSIIKQYSSDVFVSIILIYFLSGLKIRELEKKQLIILLISLMILPFVSLPSLFFAGAFFVVNFVSDFKNKTFWKKFIAIVIPFLITLTLYYVFNLEPSKANMDSCFPNYWEKGFLFANDFNLIRMFVIYLKYMFNPNNFVLMQLILWVLGIYFCFRDKSEISKYILWVFAFVILASLLKCYPFEGRVALYFVPLLVLFVVKPLDIVEIKYDLKTILLIICYIVGFCGYNHNYIKNEILEREFGYPKSLMQELISKYNAKTDVIIFNQASTANFIYYSTKLGFQPSGSSVLMSNAENSDITGYIDSFNTKINYWFYLSKDYASRKNVGEIIQNIKRKNVLFEYTKGNSHLILFQNIDK